MPEVKKFMSELLLLDGDEFMARSHHLRRNIANKNVDDDGTLELLDEAAKLLSLSKPSSGFKSASSANVVDLFHDSSSSSSCDDSSLASERQLLEYVLDPPLPIPEYTPQQGRASLFDLLDPTLPIQD